MKFQIAQRKICESKFYREIDTSKLSKKCSATCPHKKVVECIHSTLNDMSAKLADNKLSIEDVELLFYKDVEAKLQ
ncbi:hypothetical protein NVP1158O_25 [Vibrio phage 1.158.O._10N.261.45.E12]|nr:hypothetical protein NVP1158O_25 [Vibrio phage 1.158.O._10N.261.45.E12]AUR92654.1 hypothetical protein NVP1175O_26 [Vibrio phage 1.175.O._10N.261.55.B3]